MDENLSLNELTEQVQQHFINQTYAEGMQLATRALPDFPEQLALINYWRACFAARLGNTVLANEIIEMTLANGHWYGEMIFKQTPSFTNLQEDDEFLRLADISKKMREVDPVDHLPVLIVRPEDACEPGSKGCPLVLFMHGNQDSATANLPHWSHLANEGWLVAMPQSSRALWAGNYAWASFESAAEEIEAHYARLAERYALDASQIVLGGFSMGAEVALALALSGRIKAHGFILLGPGGPFMDDLEQWDALIEQGKKSGLRGVIITGQDDDTIPHENITALVKRLNSNGISTELETHPNIGHEYPPEFDDRLAHAIKYIIG